MNNWQLNRKTHWLSVTPERNRYRHSASENALTNVAGRARQMANQFNENSLTVGRASQFCSGGK